MNELKYWLKRLVGTAIGILLVLAAVFWGAWCATFLWAWHVAPIFSLPPLDVWQAAGLMLAAFALRVRLGPATIAKQTGWQRVAFVVCGPLAVLALGYMVKVMQ